MNGFLDHLARRANDSEPDLQPRRAYAFEVRASGRGPADALASMPWNDVVSHSAAPEAIDRIEVGLDYARWSAASSTRDGAVEAPARHSVTVDEPAGTGRSTEQRQASSPSRMADPAAIDAELSADSSLASPVVTKRREGRQSLPVPETAAIDRISVDDAPPARPSTRVQQVFAHPPSGKGTAADSPGRTAGATVLASGPAHQVPARGGGMIGWVGSDDSEVTDQVSSALLPATSVRFSRTEATKTALPVPGNASDRAATDRQDESLESLRGEGAIQTSVAKAGKSSVLPVGSLVPRPPMPARRNSVRLPMSEPAERGPTVHLTIGKVEIRAIAPATTPTAAAKRAAASKPAMSLAEYLERRSGVRR